jgi:DNA polymerase-1
LLDKAVPEDYDFDSAYIINAMQCRPPKTDNALKDKDFKARACAACRARVLHQVFEYPRKCVLAMGGYSNISLTGDYGYKITQKRGQLYTIRDPDSGREVVVVPTVHPAFLLRGSGNPKVFKDDITLAMGIAYEGRPAQVRQHRWEEPHNIVLRELEDLVAYARKVKELAQRPEGVDIAADIETSGFNPKVDYILAIGFYFRSPADTAAIVPKEALQDQAYCHYLRQLLLMPGVRYIWQFGKFDEKFLHEEKLLSPEETVEHEDTGLLSYALSEATKDHDLDEQAKNDLGIPEHKGMLKKWAPKKTDSYANVPEPVLFDYLAKDLKKTSLVWEHKRPQVKADANLEKLYTRTLLPASHLLAQIEGYGIEVDWDYVRLNRHELEAELAGYETELQGLVGYHVNPNSPDEVSALLYDRYQLKIKGKRPQDTTKETFEKLPPHPAVKLIRRYRSTTKMLGTYVAGIEKFAVGNRIHTTFKLHASTTGRLSSSEPNIQNIPREGRYRRMYCARPGYVLLEADYNSAELRMLAALSGDEFLTGVFLDDKRNLHDEVSIAMYGQGFTVDQRIRAKAINFGIPYGREAFSIAEEFDISTAEAQRLIDAWFERAPQAAQFIKRCRRAPLEGRTLITVFGRKRRPGVVSAERMHGLQNEFANFHMQSPISDFTLHTGMEALPLIQKHGAHFVNLVHDSTVAEVPNDPVIVRKVAEIIKEVQETVPTKWITTPIRFKVDLKVGTHWGQAQSYDKWLKAA